MWRHLDPRTNHIHRWTCPDANWSSAHVYADYPKYYNENHNVDTCRVSRRYDVSYDDPDDFSCVSRNYSSRRHTACWALHEIGRACERKREILYYWQVREIFVLIKRKVGTESQLAIDDAIWQISAVITSNCLDCSCSMIRLQFYVLPNCQTSQ